MGKFAVGDRVVIREDAIERNPLIANAPWREYTFEIIEEYPDWTEKGNSAYALAFGNYDGEVPFPISEVDLLGEYE